MIYASSVEGKSLQASQQLSTAQKLFKECWSIRATPKHLQFCENILPCIIFSTWWDWHTKHKENTAGIQKERIIFCSISYLYLFPPTLIPHKEKFLYRWSVVKENFQIFKITVNQFLCSSDLVS